MRFVRMRRRSIPILSLLFLARPAASGDVRPSAPRLEELTKDEYAALPKDAPIIENGVRTTRAAIEARVAGRREQDLERLHLELEAEAARVAVEQHQRIEQEQTPFAARSLAKPEKAGRLGIAKATPPAKVEAIRREAGELAARARKASAAELVAIDKRAAELLRQLQPPR